MSGGSSGGTSKTISEIPAELKPLASRYSSEALNLFDTPYQAYSGQGVADMNQMQLGGLGMAANRAIGGDSAINAGRSNIMDTLSGKFMNPDSNPFLKQNTQAAMDQAMGSINSQFNRPGAFGSSAHEGVASGQLGNIAAQMYGQNYNNERNNQLQAWNAAQTYGNNAYNDANQLMNAGQAMQDQTQQGLDWNYEQFQDKQNYPYRNMQAAAGVFGTNLGGCLKSRNQGNIGLFWGKPRRYCPSIGHDWADWARVLGKQPLLASPMESTR